MGRRGRPMRGISDIGQNTMAILYGAAWVIAIYLMGRPTACRRMGIELR